MTTNKEENRLHPEEPDSTENDNRDRTEQFNELSELSLEERMAVADQIGIPVRDMGEALATGTVRDRDETEEGPETAAENDRNAGESTL